MSIDYQLTIHHYSVNSLVSHSQRVEILILGGNPSVCIVCVHFVCVLCVCICMFMCASTYIVTYTAIQEPQTVYLNNEYSVLTIQIFC